MFISQLMPLEQQNAPGFYYLVKWRRQDTVTVDDPPFDERILEAGQDQLVIHEQPIYKPYEIYVLAVNEVGEAASPPKMTIGYSGEDGEVLSLPFILLTQAMSFFPHSATGDSKRLSS